MRGTRQFLKCTKNFKRGTGQLRGTGVRILRYSYFSSSLKRSDEFIKLQKKLEINSTIINQPSHTRWLSWLSTISRINEKWEALVKYFSDKGQNDDSDPNKSRRLIKLSEINLSNENPNLEEADRIKRWTNKAEKFIKETLDKRETFYYSIFLEDVLKHSSFYVNLFEKDNLDVSSIFDYQLKYLSLIISIDLGNLNILGKKSSL